MLACITLALFLTSSCKDEPKVDQPQKPMTEENQPIAYDLEDIKQSGVLRAITTFSPTGYFLYRGQTMGFQYELLSLLAKSLEVDLEIVLARNIDSVIPMLNRGEGDIIALGYTVTGDRKEDVNFTDPFLITHQSLVQRKPDNWKKLSKNNIEKSLVKDVVELLDDTVSVRHNSSYYMRLLQLSNELGDTIHTNVLSGEITDEEIIKLVAEGKIKYTVIDDNIASIHANYFDNIDIQTPISLSQKIAWAVRKTSPELLDTINKGLAQIKNKPDYNIIYHKYFENRKQFTKRIDSDYYTVITGKISVYDDLVKKHVPTLGWDWLLVKSLVYQESRFNPRNRSWAGASGLMQLMPATAKELGVTNVNNAEQNIKAGIKYLKKMYDNWEEIPDSIQRIKFAMASYNAGFGHVKDAQRLAKKFNKDTLRWDDGVDEFILNLSKPSYYHDPIVKYGYVRGSEPYNYIIEIFNRYNDYKTFTHQSN